MSSFWTARWQQRFGAKLKMYADFTRDKEITAFIFWTSTHYTQDFEFGQHMVHLCQSMWPSALLPSYCVFVCPCVFCNLSIAPTEWVCLVELWPVFSPLSFSHLSLCCSCHFISQLPTGRLTKEYGKAVVFIHSLSFMFSQSLIFHCVCLWMTGCVCLCTHVHANCSVCFCL